MVQGHQQRAFRELKGVVPFLDILLEVSDARLPYLSFPEGLASFEKQVRRIRILNKIDLAEPKKTKEWGEYFKQKGVSAVPLNAKTGEGGIHLKRLLKQASLELAKERHMRGRQDRMVHTAVIGIPNTGKSARHEAGPSDYILHSGDAAGVSVAG